MTYTYEIYREVCKEKNKDFDELEERVKDGEVGIS